MELTFTVSFEARLAEPVQRDSAHVTIRCVYYTFPIRLKLLLNFCMTGLVLMEYCFYICIIAVQSFAVFFGRPFAVELQCLRVVAGHQGRDLEPQQPVSGHWQL